jgi:hypothetical protein
MIHKFKVYREKWYRGKEAAEKDAYLFNADTQKFDIMGLLLREAKVDKGHLHKVRLPSVVAHKVLPNKRVFNEPFHWIVTNSHADTKETFDLITLNDDPYLKEEEREEKIALFLGKYGIDVRFTSAEEEAEEKRRAAEEKEKLLRDIERGRMRTTARYSFDDDEAF